MAHHSDMAERIAVLLTGAFASRGGVQLTSRNFIKALAQRPHCQADFFSLSDTTPDVRYTEGRPFQGFGGNRTRFSAAVSRALLSERYDLLLLIHCNLAPLAALWRAAVRRPYVVLVHGTEVWPRLSLLKRRILSGAAEVLSCSQFTLEKMCAANDLPPERVVVLPLAPDYFWFQEAGDTAVPDSVGPDTAPLLLTVARALKTERYKGQDTVLRAMPRILKEFPQTRYVMAGGGDDDDRLKDLARTLGVDQVEFRGRVPLLELSELFRRCSVFLMPSRGEGFGLVYLEAMHYRKPCIAGDGDAGREIVLNGVNGFTIDPANPDAVAEAVLRLLRDPAQRAAMGEAGYRLLHSQYTFTRFSEVLYGALDRASRKA